MGTDFCIEGKSSGQQNETGSMRERRAEERPIRKSLKLSLSVFLLKTYPFLASQHDSLLMLRPHPHVPFGIFHACPLILLF